MSGGTGAPKAALRFQSIWWWPVMWVNDEGDLIVRVHPLRFGKKRWTTLGFGYRWSFWLGWLEIRRWAKPR